MTSIKCITLEEEMKKNPELKIEDIKILKEWCEKQLHLPKIQDVQLAIFLHSNYYQLEPTKNTIENYYTIRTQVPELFSDRDIKSEKLQEALKVIVNCHLEQQTKEGYYIVIGRLLDFDPSHYNYINVTKCILMLMDEFLWEYGSTPGFVFVCDVTGMSFGHMTRFNLTLMKKYMHYVQEALPIRIKAMHMINTSPIMKIIFNTCKPFMKKDLQQLMHFHSSVESVNKYFPVEILPNELGGKAGPIQEIWNMRIKRLEDFQEWFVEDEKNNRINESLRIEN